MKKIHNLFALTLTLFLLSFYPCQSQSWTQIGNDIDGEAPDDESGISVSLSSDGQTVAIGAVYNDGNGENSGHVRIYNWSGSAWTQVGQDIDGEAGDDHSGFSVSLSSDGNIVAIGAIGAMGGNGSNSGYVRIYNWSGSAWTQVGNDIDGEAAGDQSGSSVSLSSDGQTVAIGAIGGNGDYSGHVRIYNWSGSAWTQVGNDIDGEAAVDISGSSVSLSSNGQTVAIGAYGNGENSGHVRIYNWSGSAWTQVGNDIDGEAEFDNSGISVSLSSDGQTVAIGAPNNDGNGENSGHVRIYNWSGSAWTQVGNDIDGEAAYDASAYSVSLSSDGQKVAIGAHGNDGNGENSGHVRIYNWSGSSWTQVGNDIDGEAASYYSGTSVSLSSNGQTVAIGAMGGNNWDYSGHVRIYELDSCAPLNLDIIGQPNILPFNSYTYVIDPTLVGYTIVWSEENGTIISGQGTNAVEVFWDGSGFGEVIVTLTNGVCTATDTLSVSAILVGINEQPLQQTNISPNPSTGIFTVNVPDQTNIQASVFDGLGKLVATSNATGTFNLDLSDVPVGIYTLRLDTESGTVTKKLVRE